MRSGLVLALAVVLLGCSAQATGHPPATDAVEENRIAGKVLEAIDAASYTYLRVETATGEAWAAVPRADVEIGSGVVILNPQTMSNFESRTLGRKFETIYFGTLEQGEGAMNPHETGHGGQGQPTAETAEAAATPIEVPRAEGKQGRTIAELYEQKSDLAGKTVALRGKVVKYSAGIMGRNWIHLQDGTGDATAANNDITVTTSDTTAVGEVILVEGTVTLDKDFGMGYRYAVIVEDASVR